MISMFLLLSLYNVFRLTETLSCRQNNILSLSFPVFSAKDGLHIIDFAM